MRAWGGSEEGPKHPSAALRCDWRVHNYVHWEGPAGRRKAGCSQTDVPSAVRVSDIVAPGPRARGVSFELGFRVLVLCCTCVGETETEASVRYASCAFLVCLLSFYNVVFLAFCLCRLFVFEVISFFHFSVCLFCFCGFYLVLFGLLGFFGFSRFLLF